MATVDWFEVVAVLSAVVLSAFTVYILLRRSGLISRFAIVTVIGWLLVFSWPVALFGSSFVFGDVSRVFFLCMMFLPPLVLLLWSWLRAFANRRGDRFAEQTKISKKLQFSVWGLIILWAAIVVWPLGNLAVVVLLVMCLPPLLYLVWVKLRKLLPAGQGEISYWSSARGIIELSVWTLGIVGTAILVSSVGFGNLAVVVAVFDPDDSYSAREENIKLNPSMSARFAWALVTNVFLPTAGVLAVMRLISGIQSRNMLKLMTAAFTIVILHPLALATGSKGNLIPLYIGLTAALIYGLKNKWKSGLALLLIGSSGLLGLAAWNIYADRSSFIPEGNSGATAEIAVFADQTSDYIVGVIRRAFVVPSEVALQNMRFAEEVKKLELAILPFFPFATSDLHLSSEVARIYQPGDFAQFPLSTAPTNSIILLPAHMGIPGLAIVLALLIALDEILLSLTRGQGPVMMALSLALVGVMAYLAIVSEFQTMVLSHGGAGIFVALATFSAIQTAMLHVRRDGLNRSGFV